MDAELAASFVPTIGFEDAVVVGAGGRTSGVFRIGRAAAGVRGGEEGWARRAARLRGGVLRGTGWFSVALAAAPMADFGRISRGFLATIRLLAARFGAGLGPAGPAIARRFAARFTAVLSFGLAGFSLDFRLRLDFDLISLFLLILSGFLTAALLRLAGRAFFCGALPAPGLFLLAIDPLLPQSVDRAAAHLRRSLAMERPRSNISDAE